MRRSVEIAVVNVTIQVAVFTVQGSRLMYSQKSPLKVQAGLTVNH